MWRSAAARMPSRSNQIARRASTQIPGSICRRDLSMFGDEVVVGVADDLDANELTNRQLPANVYAAVDVRGIGFGTSDELDFRFWILDFGLLTNQAVFPGVHICLLKVAWSS